MPFEYAVTAKKTRLPIEKVHYLDYLNKITDLGKVGNVYFETTKGLHVHFKVITDTKLNYKKLTPTKRGWNVKAIPIYNNKGWLTYCRKDHEEQVPEIKELHGKYDSEEYIKPIFTKNIFKRYRSIDT